MLLVIINCEIFQKSRTKWNYVDFVDFLESLQILLIFKVALMVPIKYLISPNVPKKLLETFRKNYIK